MKNLFDLSNERVLITGSAGSIGGSAARACAILGAELIITDLNRPTELEKELRDSGVSVRAYALDNAIRMDVNSLFREVGPLDALVDCSGYYVKGDWERGDEDWDKLFEITTNVNTRGPVNLLRATLPSMIERCNGRIALTTSMAARNGGSTSTVEPAYIASKGAFQSLVRYFARQVAGSGVVVNAVSPGPIMTPLLESAGHKFDLSSYPMKRLGKPDEIGWPLAFLASKATSFMTGAVIDVNGGMAFS